MLKDERVLTFEMKFESWKDAAEYFDTLTDIVVDSGWHEDDFRLMKTAQGAVVFAIKRINMHSESVPDMVDFLKGITFEGRAPTVRVR